MILCRFRQGAIPLSEPHSTGRKIMVEGPGPSWPILEGLEGWFRRRGQPSEDGHGRRKEAFPTWQIRGNGESHYYTRLHPLTGVFRGGWRVQERKNPRNSGGFHRLFLSTVWCSNQLSYSHRAPGIITGDRQMARRPLPGQPPSALEDRAGPSRVRAARLPAGPEIALLFTEPSVPTPRCW
jgi:hypothetical protein